MRVRRILVAGGGFAGLWSAVGAARQLRELGQGPDAVEVTLINADAYHSIRVRNYEADLSGVRVPLDDVLEPVGVRRIEAEIIDVDPDGQTVTARGASGTTVLEYDRLVFALGSRLVRPAIPGLAEFGFDVDTFEAASRLDRQIQQWSSHPTISSDAIVVVGGGFTGIEVATELAGRIRKVQADSRIDQAPRVILVERNAWIGSDMGPEARSIIASALSDLGLETRVGTEVVSISASGLVLSTGETIPTRTVVWCGGMRAHPLTERFPVERDDLGRLPVDAFLRLEGVPGVFAAGDAAWMRLDGERCSVMSCQHSRPMGRFAGHNVVRDLFGLPLLPLAIDWYVTVLDLGTWGALYTEEWDRRVVSQGLAAKGTKQVINRQRIYPPLNGNAEEILAAAAPVVQARPATQR